MFYSNEKSLMEEFKSKIQERFEVKLYGPLKSFIRWKIKLDKRGIMVCQTQNAKRLINRFGIDGWNPFIPPIGIKADLTSKLSTEESLENHQNQLYRSMVGGLSYLATCNRPDISFYVSSLSRHMQISAARNMLFVKRVFRYISGTLDMGSLFPSNTMINPSSLLAAVDSGWGVDVETRKPSAGFIIAINSAPVYWRSKRQFIVTISSGEAEYVTLSPCARDVTWIRKMFWQM